MKGSYTKFGATESQLFERLDEAPDENFYSTPRLVPHKAEQARFTLSEFYKSLLTTDSIVLDLMSSWTSHLPETPKPAKVVGHGMNEEELAANTILDNYFIQNLNKTSIRTLIQILLQIQFHRLNPSLILALRLC